MTKDPFTGQLSEYLDGELSAAERAALDAHLAVCLECRTTLDELRDVLTEALSLEDSLPRRELWTGIAARIGTPPARVSLFRRAISSRLSFTLPQLAAAALALMVLSGGLVWMARSGDPRADIQPISAQVADTPPVTPIDFADPHYDEAIADLERTLETGRTTLDPETLRILEDSLGAIDRAIDECRGALAVDPANVYLNTHLAEARQRKLTLLRRASALGG